MKFFAPITDFLKHLRHNARFEPSRDWLVLLTLSTFFLIGIIVWNIWAFNIVANGGVIGKAPSEAVPVFSTSSLNSIESVFTNRADEEAKYVTGVYRYADPSQ